MVIRYQHLIASDVADDVTLLTYYAMPETQPPATTRHHDIIYRHTLIAQSITISLLVLESDEATATSSAF